MLKRWNRQDWATDWMLGMRRRPWGNADTLLQGRGLQKGEQIQRERESRSGVLLYLRELQVEFGREILTGSADAGSGT